ncbi:MAG: EamA family transporter [Eubacterium sp.]|nr:EamA family transporter [Eubacterium sp.]
MEKKKGILFIAAAAVLMSTGGLLIKSVQASAMTVALARAFFAALVFCPFMQWKKIRFSRHLVGLVISYVYLTFAFVTATKMTTAANAIILQCTAPLWLYLGYIITGKKKIVLGECAPRLVILAGILVILFDPANASGDATKMIGNLLALSAGISYAAEQYFLEQQFPMSDVTVVGILNISMALVIVLLMGSQISFAQVTPLGWGFLVFLGVFQIGISYVLFRKGVVAVSAFEASILSLLEPILNPILVFFFLGEAPSLYTIIGFAVILGGIVMTLLPGRAGKETPSQNRC